MSELSREVANLRRENEKLREALEPFDLLGLLGVPIRYHPSRNPMLTHSRK